MELLSRKALAAKLHLDPRNSFFDRLPVAASVKDGSKSRKFFNAAYAEVDPVQLLDYMRLQREKNPIRKRLLEKHLEQVHGSGWLGILEAKVSK